MIEKPKGSQKYKWMTPEKLRLLVAYDCETGNLIWLPRSNEVVQQTRYKVEGKNSIIQWNSRCAGKLAFTTRGSHGYLYGTIFGVPFTAHRVAWALHYGEWPGEVDHINRIRDDNRISNLRVISHRENMLNTVQQQNPDNGVSWHSANKKWTAYYGGRKDRRHIGSFETKEGALAARRKFIERMASDV